MIEPNSYGVLFMDIEIEPFLTRNISPRHVALAHYRKWTGVRSDGALAWACTDAQLGLGEEGANMARDVWIWHCHGRRCGQPAAGKAR